MRNVREILSRLQDAVRADSLDELSVKLGVARSTLNGWVTRDSAPYEKCVEVAQELNISLDWLILGRTEPRQEQKSHLEEAPSGAEVVSHQVRRLEIMWRILGQLADAAASESDMRVRLDCDAKVMHEACLALHRQALIKWEAPKWALSAKDAVLRATSDEDISVVAAEAMKLMTQQILPGAQDVGGAVVIADLRVSGALPGQKVMGALRNILEATEEPNGKRVRLVIGVAVENEDQQT